MLYQPDEVNVRLTPDERKAYRVTAARAFRAGYAAPRLDGRQLSVASASYADARFPDPKPSGLELADELDRFAATGVGPRVQTLRAAAAEIRRLVGQKTPASFEPPPIPKMTDGWFCGRDPA